MSDHHEPPPRPVEPATSEVLAAAIRRMLDLRDQLVDEGQRAVLDDLARELGELD